MILMHRLVIRLVLLLTLAANGTGALRFAHNAIEHSGPQNLASCRHATGCNAQSTAPAPDVPAVPPRDDHSRCPTCFLLAVNAASIAAPPGVVVRADAAPSLGEPREVAIQAASHCGPLGARAPPNGC
jgi:hypothetical protein